MPAAAKTIPEGVEPTTLEEPGRYAILPIRHPDIWKYYKAMEAADWVAGEVDFTKDRNDWNAKMSAGDRAFYRNIFGMFSVGDELVIDNLGEQFCREFKTREVVYVLNRQALNEQVHAESYGLQIAALFDEEGRAEINQAIVNMPAVKKMMGWARKWMDATRPLGTRQAGFAFFEGCLFQGQFLCIQLLKTRNLLPGVTQLNEFIARDEGTHCDFACFMLKNKIKCRPSVQEFHEIAREAVLLFDEFCKFAIADAKAAEGLSAAAPCPVMHITADKMRDYIRSVADFICVKAGYPACFNVENPYPEASKQSLNGVSKTNFFESEPTQYNIALDARLNPRASRRKRLGFCQSLPAAEASAAD